MSFTILATGLSWYDKLVEKIPEGRLFSWRAVFDAIPDLLEHLPTTLGLTLAGAFFGLMNGYGATAPNAHVFKIVLEDQAGNEVDGELQVTINPAAE